jgi:hypothetical protein
MPAFQANGPNWGKTLFPQALMVGYGRRCKKPAWHKDFFDFAPLQDNHG